MKIGIDISVFCHDLDGIGKYTKDIVEYISKNDKVNEIYLYADRPLKFSMDLNTRFKYRICNGKMRTHLAWLLLILPRQIRKDRLDVFWQPNFILPFKIKNVKNIVTVHDMSAYAYSQYAPTKTNITHKLFLKRTCKMANQILVVSYNVKNELKKYIKINDDKIKVIYTGFKALNKKNDDTEELKYLKKFNLDFKKYLLFVGTLSPRKNADVIIKAYLKYRNSGGESKLVLAGNIADKCTYLIDLIKNTKYEEDIYILGYVSEEEKNALYIHSQMVLYPSRIEGYGFPLLEAMSYGIPVITSNKSCMPEIAGDAAIYLQDIDSYKELAKLIFEVESMDKEKKDNLLKNGFNRVKFFENAHGEEKTYNILILK